MARGLIRTSDKTIKTFPNATAFKGLRKRINGKPVYPQ